MAALKTALVIFSIFRNLGLRNILAIDAGDQQQVSQFTTSADLTTTNDVPALFVFGDSIVDTGNNNWLFTLARADFPPYGQNFMNSVPTGRFSDGPLVEDYLANFLGLPLVPPYAAAGDNITKGACFASAGSGIFDTTGEIYGQVIPLSKQIEHFGEVKLSLTARLGEEEASLLVSKALFLVVAGSDDFLGHYRANSILISPSHNQSNYIFSSAFQESLLSQFIDQIQALYDLGARKIAIFNVPAVGCVPSMLIQADGECVSSLNEAVKTYNAALLASITSMQTSNLAEAHLVYCNAFDIAIKIITSPSQYGFVDAKTACCGWGEYNGAVPCLPFIHEVCQNASNNVFWDFVHPSSATYEIVANAFWNGSNEYTTPINLQQLSSR